MDYIQEELLRQQRALAALMTGRDRPEPEWPESAIAPPPAAEDEREAPAGRPDPAGAGTVLRGPGKETPAWAVRAASVLGEGSGVGPEAGTAAAEMRRMAAARGLRRRNGGLLEKKDGGREIRAAESGGAAGHADGWPSRGNLPWETAAPAGEGTADARALSRAIQRDARRYDGGFSLY